MAGGRPEAAASSTNQRKSPETGRTREAGKQAADPPPSSRIARRTRAFPAPDTRKSTVAAPFSNGNVTVTRENASSGRFATAVQRTFSSTAEEPGRSDAVWPSAPNPRRTRSNRGGTPRKNPFSSSSYAPAASSGDRPHWTGWTCSGSTGTWSSSALRTIAALLCGESDGTHRSSPQKRCTRSHGTRPRCGSTARSSYVRRGVSPPARSAENRPRASTASRAFRAKRSAAARPSASASTNRSINPPPRPSPASPSCAPPGRSEAPPPPAPSFRPRSRGSRRQAPPPTPPGSGRPPPTRIPPGPPA